MEIYKLDYYCYNCYYYHAYQLRVEIFLQVFAYSAIISVISRT